MGSQEIRDELKRIQKEQSALADAVNRYNQLEFAKESLKIVCTHENAYVHNVETDNYEMRTYATIICHDCMKQWEERVYMGKCKYPKYEYGMKW